MACMQRKPRCAANPHFSTPYFVHFYPFFQNYLDKIDMSQMRPLRELPNDLLYLSL